MFLEMVKRLNSCITFLFLLNLILGATDGRSVDKTSSRTCVIGAGYSGLAAARYLKQYNANFTVFEATRFLGGTWRFDPNIEVDEDGTPVYTKMYKNLRTNTPIQTMEFYDFEFPDGTPSYPTATCFYEYLQRFAKKFDLRPHIAFRRIVTSVKWNCDHWSVTYTCEGATNVTERCDFVIVATGELAKAVLPAKFPGQDLFKGKIMHSKYYKDPEEYRGTRLLVVGAGPSGLDMILHLTNVTAKLVHSHHFKYNEQYYGKNFVKKPDIKEFTADGVIFQDDSYEAVDNVLFCTGYAYDFPFLDPNVGMTMSDKYVLPLYQHIVNIRHPTMAFIGISKKIVNKVIDAQAHYAALIAAKKFQLPPQDVMLKSWFNQVYNLQDKRMKLTDINVVGDDLHEYCRNLTLETKLIPCVPKVVTNIRDHNSKFRLEDLMNYRNYDFKIVDDEKFDKTYNPPRGKLPNCPFDEEKDENEHE